MKSKNLIKIGIVFFAGILLTVSCEKDSFLEDQFSGSSKKLGEYVSIFVDAIPESACNVTTYGLIAGQYMDVGSVSVASDADFVYVKYCTSQDYPLVETHLFLGDISDLPVNKKGNPVIGKFPYSSNGAANANEDGCIIHRIPRSEITLTDDGEIDIAAHAVVLDDEEEETAWGTNEVEDEVIFALKALMSDGFATTYYGINVTPDCSYSLGYYTINLGDFIEKDFELFEYWTLSPPVKYKGNVSVVLNGDQLIFTITGLENETVKESWLFVGTVEELRSWINTSGCLAYNLWSDPMPIQEEGEFHQYIVDVSEFSNSGDIEMYTIEGVQRWGYYLKYTLDSCID
ncbi:MAG: hypothetical protein P1P82_17830 [Bacteroidales bacterium]|nr:hypothetical protein [Bacteroidales bacterium]